jgi:hypothetical protein
MSVLVAGVDEILDRWRDARGHRAGRIHETMSARHAFQFTLAIDLTAELAVRRARQSDRDCEAQTQGTPRVAEAPKGTSRRALRRARSQDVQGPAVADVHGPRPQAPPSRARVAASALSAEPPSRAQAAPPAHEEQPRSAGEARTAVGAGAGQAAAGECSAQRFAQRVGVAEGVGTMGERGTAGREAARGVAVGRGSWQEQRAVDVGAAEGARLEVEVAQARLAGALVRLREAQAQPPHPGKREVCGRCFALVMRAEDRLGSAQATLTLAESLTLAEPRRPSAPSDRYRQEAARATAAQSAQPAAAESARSPRAGQVGGPGVGLGGELEGARRVAVDASPSPCAPLPSGGQAATPPGPCAPSPSGG